MKDKLIVTLLGIVILLQLGSFYKGMKSKVGLVNMERILLESPEAKKAQAQLEEAKAKYEELVQKRQEELTKEQQRVRTNYGLARLQKKMEKYKKELAAKQEELIKLNDDLNKKIRTLIVSKLEQIAKKKGVKYVYDEKSIYLADVDLTKDLLSLLKASEPPEIPLVITENMKPTKNNVPTVNK